MGQLILIRPGQTDFDRDKRIQGKLDVPLNEDGKREVDLIATDLAPLGVKTILTGPCNPALETAELLGSRLNVPVKSLDSLRNLCQGLWEGLPIDEIKRMYPTIFKQWADSPETVKIPEGEPALEAIQRLATMLKKYKKKKETYAIVASEPIASFLHYLGVGQAVNVEDFTQGRKLPSWEILGESTERESVNQN